MSRFIETLGWDAVILEFDLFNTQIEREAIRQDVAEQLEENGVAVLPIGVKAKVIRRDKCVVKGEIYGEIH